MRSKVKNSLGKSATFKAELQLLEGLLAQHQAANQLTTAKIDVLLAFRTNSGTAGISERTFRNAVSTMAELGMQTNGVETAVDKRALENQGQHFPIRCVDTGEVIGYENRFKERVEAILYEEVEKNSRNAVLKSLSPEQLEAVKCGALRLVIVLGVHQNGAPLDPNSTPSTAFGFQIVCIFFIGRDGRVFERVWRRDGTATCWGVELPTCSKCQFSRSFMILQS